MRASRHSRPRRRDSIAEGGFSLLEVLVALAIFTLSMVVLAQSYINTLNAVARRQPTQIRDQDLAFVRQELLLASSRENAETGGTLNTYGSGFIRWSAGVEPTSILDLFRVELELELLEGDILHRQVLYLLRPGWSDAEDRRQLLEQKREELSRDRATREWAP